MSTRGSRGNSSNGNRRRKAALGLDLNVPPSESGRDQEGPSGRGVPQEGQASRRGATLPTNLIDVDAIEDEVVFSSPGDFAEAKQNSTRRHTRNSVIDVDSGNTVIITERATRPAVGIRNKRRRIPPNEPIINCEHYIDLDGSFNSKKKSAEKPMAPPPPPPPPPTPTFSCPICMGSLVEEMSTKCGHIFCKACIKAAISAKTSCPTCRRKVTAKDIIRVYLPTTS